MTTALAFIATWLLLGVVVGWATHSKTITGRRDDD